MYALAFLLTFFKNDFDFDLFEGSRYDGWLLQYYGGGRSIMQ